TIKMTVRSKRGSPIQGAATSNWPASEGRAGASSGAGNAALRRAVCRTNAATIKPRHATRSRTCLTCASAGRIKNTTRATLSKGALLRRPVRACFRVAHGAFTPYHERPPGAAQLGRFRSFNSQSGRAPSVSFRPLACARFAGSRLDPCKRLLRRRCEVRMVVKIVVPCVDGAFEHEVPDRRAQRRAPPLRRDCVVLRSDQGSGDI